MIILHIWEGIGDEKLTFGPLALTPMSVVMNWTASLNK